MRYPLRVAKAMRKSWPKEKPMSVRISANDWVGEEGITPQESVKIAKMFKAIWDRHNRCFSWTNF